jgi:hypothetical protein
LARVKCPVRRTGEARAFASRRDDGMGTLTLFDDDQEQHGMTTFTPGQRVRPTSNGDSGQVLGLAPGHTPDHDMVLVAFDPTGEREVYADTLAQVTAA